MTQKFTESGRTRINNQRTIPLERYEEEGCADRAEYFESLAEDYGVSLRTVLAVSEIFGPDEDFDGLLTSIQDAEGDW